MRLAACSSAFTGVVQKDLRAFTLHSGVGDVAPVQTKSGRFLGDGCGCRGGLPVGSRRTSSARRLNHDRGLCRDRACAAAAAGAARNVWNRRGRRIVDANRSVPCGADVCTGNRYVYLGRSGRCRSCELELGASKCQIHGGNLCGVSGAIKEIRAGHGNSRRVSGNNACGSNGSDRGNRVGRIVDDKGERVGEAVGAGSVIGVGINGVDGCRSGLGKQGRRDRRG